MCLDGYVGLSLTHTCTIRLPLYLLFASLDIWSKGVFAESSVPSLVSYVAVNKLTSSVRDVYLWKMC